MSAIQPQEGAPILEQRQTQGDQESLEGTNQHVAPIEEPIEQNNEAHRPLANVTTTDVEQKVAELVKIRMEEVMGEIFEGMMDKLRCLRLRNLESDLESNRDNREHQVYTKVAGARNNPENRVSQDLPDVNRLVEETKTDGISIPEPEIMIERTVEIKSPDEVAQIKQKRRDDKLCQDDVSKWIPEDNLADDIWRHIFWSIPSEASLSIQKELRVRSTIHTYRLWMEKRKMRDAWKGQMSAIISILGYRIHKVCREFEVGRRYIWFKNSPLSDTHWSAVYETVARVMAEITYFPNLNSVSLGEVIDHCYSMRIFPLDFPIPADNPETPSTIPAIVLAALYIISFGETDWDSYRHAFLDLMLDVWWDDAQATPVPASFYQTTWRRVKENARSKMGGRTKAMEESRDNSKNSPRGIFTVEDFTLPTLVELGSLHITWTHNPTEHLILSGDDLSVYWFDAYNGHCSGFLQEHSNITDSACHEVDITQKFLFGYRNKLFSSQKRRLYKVYSRMDVPYWLKPLHQTMCGQSTNFRSTLGSVMKSKSWGMEFHLSQGYSNRASQWQYSDFPVYGQRLKILREHMDTVKPHGLKGLLKDNRDSVAFYTFWFAVIIGTSSILLGAASLAVTAVQTWATLNPPH